MIFFIFQGASISNDILPGFLNQNCQFTETSPAQQEENSQPTENDQPITKSQTESVQPNSDVQQVGKKTKSESAKPITHHYAFPQVAAEANLTDTTKAEGSADSDSGSNDNQAHSLAVSDILNSLQGVPDSQPPQKQRKKNKKPQKPPTPQRAWGELSHAFKFISAYDHYKIDRLLPDYHPEVTTKHFDEEGLNVDFIFSTGKFDILLEIIHELDLWSTSSTFFLIMHTVFGMG